MISFFREYRKAQKLMEEEFDVIFYAESAFYFQYFQHLFDSVSAIHGIKVAYITSDRNDPVLKNERVEAYYLKSTLAGVFPRLRSRIMIMTMPDLDNFIFKRSKNVGRYVYVFHALVSTHLQYRLHAFDHYDTIFCTGPQQMEEIRKTEVIYGLPAKDLVPYGYPFLGSLENRLQPAQKKILVAPSWYAEGILKTCILPVLHQLEKTGYEIWLRPHPEFIKREKKTWKKIMSMAAEKGISIDTGSSVYAHLSDAAFLVTDRSGIAFEFALATKRPVIFIDTPLKIQNPEWEKLNIEPLENHFRYVIGKGVKKENPELLPEVIQTAQSDDNFPLRVSEVENQILFDSSHHSNGIDYLVKILNSSFS